MKTIYIAGPMRGYPRFNFDAFEAAEKDLLAQGFSVISPHRMDLDLGFNPGAENALDSFSLDDAILRDVGAIIKADIIVMLDGWRKSKGACCEKMVAEWAGREVLNYPDLTPVASEDILHEAYRLTSGDRNNTYGPPDQDFKRTATMWAAILDAKVDAKDVALCMIALKLSRATWMSKRDNWTDIAGYARCGFLCDKPTV